MLYEYNCPQKSASFPMILLLKVDFNTKCMLMEWTNAMQFVAGVFLTKKGTVNVTLVKLVAFR